MAGSRPIYLEPSLANPFLYFLQFLIERNQKHCHQGTTFHDSGRCLTLQGMPQITQIWCRPISGLATWSMYGYQLPATWFQAEQEVHRDLCDLALPGLHVHSSLPSSHSFKWTDLCRGQLSCWMRYHLFPLTLVMVENVQVRRARDVRAELSRSQANQQNHISTSEKIVPGHFSTSQNRMQAFELFPSRCGSSVLPSCSLELSLSFSSATSLHSLPTFLRWKVLLTSRNWLVFIFSIFLAPSSTNWPRRTTSWWPSTGANSHFGLELHWDMISLLSSSVNFIIYCIFGEKFRRVLLQRVAGCQGYHLRTHSTLRQELHNLEVAKYCYVDFHRQILFKTSCLKQSPQSRGFKLLSRWYWSKRTHVFAGRWVDGATCADTRPDHLTIWPFTTM